MTLPAFLRSEYFPYTSVEIVSAAEVPSDQQLVARKTDTAPDCEFCDGYAFVGHVCPAEFDADQDPHPDDDREEDFGAECGAGCGYCGRCS